MGFQAREAMPNISNEDLGTVKKMVLDQLEDLRRTRDSLSAEGKMTVPLYSAICRECDRLNGLETRLNEAMDVS